MFGIGLPELLIILVVALIVVGPSKLPDLAKSLGKGLSEFKKAADDLKSELHQNDAYQDVVEIKKSFKDTVDSMKPGNLLDAATGGEVKPKDTPPNEVKPADAGLGELQPKEPQLDLSGRQAVYDSIEAEQATPEEAAAPGEAEGEAAAVAEEKNAASAPQTGQAPAKNHA